jgi:hypothetical protein
LSAPAAGLGICGAGAVGTDAGKAGVPDEGGCVGDESEVGFSEANANEALEEQMTKHPRKAAFWVIFCIPP